MINLMLNMRAVIEVKELARWFIFKDSDTFAKWYYYY